MSLDEVKQIPPWFVWVAFTLLISGFVIMVKYIIESHKNQSEEDKKKNDKRDEKIDKMVDSITELSKVTAIYGFQIKDNTDDIRELRSRLSGLPSITH